ncbi:MAG: hypothetical protein ACTS5A_03320 [Candidatus Hodgkinia cicadicola]
MSIWASALRRTNQPLSIEHCVRFESLSEVRRTNSPQVALITSEANISRLTNFRRSSLRAVAAGLGLKRAKTAHTPTDISEISSRILRSFTFRRVPKRSSLRNVGPLCFATSWSSLFGVKSRRRLNYPSFDSSNALTVSPRLVGRFCVLLSPLRRPLSLLFWAKLPLRSFNSAKSH